VNPKGGHGSSQEVFSVSEDDEIIQAFLEESRENLDHLDRDLVDLEARPTDPDLLARVFRTIHTIKGTCGFLGYGRLEALTHVGENLLGSLRTGDIVLDAAITSSLLRLIDAVRSVLDQIQSTGAEGDHEHAELLADLAHYVLPVTSREKVAERAAPVPESLLRPAGREHSLAAALLPMPDAPRPSAEAAPVPEVVAVTPMETSVRIDVAVLDKLLNLVGELVLAGSRIGEQAKDQQDGPMALANRQLHLVTNELQECVMQARLQPVGLVTGKFRRIARDLATALEKQVIVELEGEEVGVDKAVNEALKDPLLHLVRNAIDHGLESPTQRAEVGKSPEGRLVLRSTHESGRVRVEVSDDGRGIDASRLVQKAISIGILTNEEASQLTRAEALGLIFLPGLTTSEVVTNISGRGVGMDVVRASLEAVGGSIEVSSDAGQGTAFKISVPLTLSIMPVLITWCVGERYAIPQVDVEEVIHLGKTEVATSIDDIRGARIYSLRGCLLPLVDLASELALGSADTRESLEFVVVRTEGRHFGIIVDSVGDAVGAVVKPLTIATRSIPVFGGITILGDGGLSLILDTGGLATAAGIESKIEEAPTFRTAAHADTTSALLVTRTNGSHFAVRLALVDRLEHFQRASIEHVGMMNVVQYRNGILPLIPLAELLPTLGTDPTSHSVGTDSEEIHAVVCESSSGLIGLVVDSIEDIVPEPMDLPVTASRRGVSASFILDERVTELLDIDVLVAATGIGVPA
jgi:two-component system chemotaxis sensor kinase CheA